ncbi:hypothetical protein EEL39_14710 [Muribaculaceae bacterium Isolate-080 (Janvier)]|jgi:hypothetical protein|nr:hypothetical protein EEL39_14710 [Muribaculaceae bacterium Isolate-080 (Janvier)]
MRIIIRNSSDGKVMKWIKLSIFAIGALIAIPLIIVATIATISEYLAHNFISWLKEFTNTDVNW